jgi:hypothetical protein
LSSSTGVCFDTPVHASAVCIEVRDEDDFITDLGFDGRFVLGADIRARESELDARADEERDNDWVCEFMIRVGLCSPKVPGRVGLHWERVGIGRKTLFTSVAFGMVRDLEPGVKTD